MSIYYFLYYSKSQSTSATLWVPHFVTSYKWLKNIIFKLHAPYYLQEISAPEGYLLDETKHWFYICPSTDTTCEQCASVPKHEGMIKAPEQEIHATNTFGGPILPNTGGVGGGMYTVGGTLLMLAALILLYNQKKCRKEDYRSSWGTRAFDS